jgi:hypothetical protein
LQIKKLVVFAITILMIAAIIIPAALAELTTDKSDYAADEPVNITGTGFLANQTVTLTLTGPDDFTTYVWDTTSDENGTIQTTYNEGLMNGEFSLTATDGVTPEQTTTFSDSNVYISLTSFSPTSVIAGSDVTFSLSITNDEDSKDVDSVAISMPSIDGVDWGTPSGVSIGGDVSGWVVDSGTGAGLLKIKVGTPTPDHFEPEQTMTISFTITAPSKTSETNTWSITAYDTSTFNGKTDTETQNVAVKALTVTKTVSTSLTTTYTWTVHKTANPSSLTLGPGDTANVQYTVDVTVTSADSDWAASGSITIHNPSVSACNISSINDIVSATPTPISGAVTLPEGVVLPYSLAGGGELVVTYSASLPDDASRTNNATVTVGAAVFFDEEAVSFASPTINRVHPTVAVTDSYEDVLDSELNYDEAPAQYKYTRTVGGETTPGTYEVKNTAYVKEGTTTLASEECTVTVHVEGSSVCSVTSKGYQDLEGTFKLIFTPDMPLNPGASRLTASNPGQFSFNVYVYDRAGETVTLTIPYPFVTQGANPIHIYSAVGADGLTPAGSDITYVFDLDGSGAPWLIADWGTESFGDTHEISIDIPGDYDEGVYITIHLDYGLKKVAGDYAKDNDLNAKWASATNDYDPIDNNQPYMFSVTAPITGSDTISNLNTFKNDPGIGGLVLDEYGAPVQNEQVDIYLGKSLYGTAFTDEDGWYMVTFKYTGKPVTFTIITEHYGEQKETLRANGFLVVDFDASATPTTQTTDPVTNTDPPTSPSGPGKGKK